MSESLFITLAYAITGALVAGLCLATFLRARRVHKALTENGAHEA